MKRTPLALAILFLTLTASSQNTRSQTQPPPLVSPEVHADRSVTFRFRAPNVKEVAVSIEGSSKPLPMQKDDQGVWSVTTDPLAPDYYGYSFTADGVGLFDPSNHSIKPNFLYRASEMHVPGAASLSWEIGAVPHGEIHHHFYKSGVVGDDRGFFVYTPPGYDPRGNQTYPVFYLLHGFSDDASAWTAVGRANVILDNLIAQGKAKPMLIVMPLGYGEPKVLEPHSGVFHDPAITQRNFDKFREALLAEVRLARAASPRSSTTTSQRWTPSPINRSACSGLLAAPTIISSTSIEISATGSRPEASSTRTSKLPAPTPGWSGAATSRSLLRFSFVEALVLVGN